MKSRCGELGMRELKVLHAMLDPENDTREKQAVAAGVGVSTIYNYMRRDYFRIVLRDRQRDLTNSIIYQLARKKARVKGRIQK